MAFEIPVEELTYKKDCSIWMLSRDILDSMYEEMLGIKKDSALAIETNGALSD